MPGSPEDQIRDLSDPVPPGELPGPAAARARGEQRRRRQLAASSGAVAVVLVLAAVGIGSMDGVPWQLNIEGGPSVAGAEAVASPTPTPADAEPSVGPSDDPSATPDPASTPSPRVAASEPPSDAVDPDGEPAPVEEVVLPTFTRIEGITCTDNGHEPTDGSDEPDRVTATYRLHLEGGSGWEFDFAVATGVIAIDLVSATHVVLTIRELDAQRVPIRAFGVPAAPGAYEVRSTSTGASHAVAAGLADLWTIVDVDTCDLPEGFVLPDAVVTFRGCTRDADGGVTSRYRLELLGGEGWTFDPADDFEGAARSFGDIAAVDGGISVDVTEVPVVPGDTFRAPDLTTLLLRGPEGDAVRYSLTAGEEHAVSSCEPAEPEPSESPSPSEAG